MTKKKDPLKNKDLWIEAAEQETGDGEAELGMASLLLAHLAMSQPLVYEENLKRVEGLLWVGGDFMSNLLVEVAAEVAGLVGRIERTSEVDAIMDDLDGSPAVKRSRADLMGALEKHIGPMTGDEKEKALEWAELCHGHRFDDCERGPGGVRIEQVAGALTVLKTRQIGATNAQRMMEGAFMLRTSRETLGPAWKPETQWRPVLEAPEKVIMAASRVILGYEGPWELIDLERALCRFATRQASMGRRGHVTLTIPADDLGGLLGLAIGDEVPPAMKLLLDDGRWLDQPARNGALWEFGLYDKHPSDTTDPTL